MIDPILFNKGLNLKKSPLLCEQGDLVSSSGLRREKDGEIRVRVPLETVNTTPLSSINQIHRYINYVLATSAANVYYKWDLDGYCSLYTPPNTNFTLSGSMVSSERPKITDYEGFSFITTGHDKKAFTQGNLYEWGVDNPQNPPQAASGSAGNPNGAYTLYYTYYVLFPNGYAYETAPSPAGTVTVSNAKIEWKGIGICPYQGTGLVIHRRLYRTSTTLISTYYVTTIQDNTTTTYSDNFTDAEMQASDAIETDGFNTPQNFNDTALYLQRMFGVIGSDLCFSEPYDPFAFPTTSYITVTKDGEDLTTVLYWGDQLYMSSAKRWYRLQGSSDDTWVIRNTFTDKGSINPHTAKVTRHGIICEWWDGIYIFDGSLSRSITDQRIGTAFFDDIVSRKSSWASWDGRKYRYCYCSTGTTPDKALIIDFTNYPNIVFDHEDIVLTAYNMDGTTGIEYFARGAYQYKEGTTETITASLETGDLTGKEFFKQKQGEYLYYDIDTNGEDVTLSVYFDDVATTYTINHTGRTKKRLPLGNKQGYRCSIGLSCADAKDLVIYEPWAISFNPFGV